MSGQVDTTPLIEEGHAVELQPVTLDDEGDTVVADAARAGSEDGALMALEDGEGGGAEEEAAPMSDEEKAEVMGRISKQFTSVLIPTSITMFLVAGIVLSLGQPSVNRASVYMPFAESSTASTGEKLGGAIVNALILIGVVFLTTIIFVVLYKYRCMKLLYGWLITSSSLLLGVMGGYLLRTALVRFQLPMDWLTFLLIMFNFSIGGIISMFWRGPLLLQQAYLVAVSAIMAWSFTKIPEWTTWAILAVFAIYDIFAVLAPKGPLKTLVETAQKRDEPIPGLIYDAKHVKLGLGDFIFYSILVARGATLHDVTTVFACYIAVVMGLCLTLLLLGVFRRALPALPISIAAGMLFYYVTRTLIVPFAITIALGGAMV